MSKNQLTEYQAKLIAESFAAVAPRGAALVARFYQRLFQDHANLKPLFDPANQHYQQKYLLASLAQMIEKLPTGEATPLEFQPSSDSELGDANSHSRQLVFRSTLLKTLAEFTGDVWGSELEEAWDAVCMAAEERCESASTVAAAL